MARVPQAQDIGVSSFNVGSAAQIDIGVAKEIGRAGSAIGDAVAALGGAFAEVAGKAGAAQSAQAEADYILDWNQKDFDVWGGLSKNETPDGTSWQAAAPLYTETFNSHRNDPKYSSIPPQRKLALDRQIAGSIQQRIIGEGGAARRYQAGQYNTLIQDLETRKATTIGELGPDSPLVKDLPPTQGDSAYNRLYEERRNALHAKIDASVGLTLSPKQAEEQKAKIDADLFATKLQWLQKNDPEAYEKALEEADKLEREEITQPEAGGATSETWRGPDSQGRRLDGASNLGGPQLSEQQVSRLKGVRPELVDRLASLQQQFGKELPINSGFRDRGHNAKVGGAKGSQHIHGNAVDLDVRDLSKEERVELIRQASALGFTGIGVYNNAIHLDLGNRRSWGPNYSSNSVPKWAQAAVNDHLSGRMGALGSDDSRRVQAAQSGGFTANLTAYSPQRAGSRMEGGYAAARPGPDGKAEVRTLDDVLSGRSDYVTLAGNPKQYGKEYIIPSITYVDKSGKEHTLKNVRAVVHDTGGAFKKAGEDRFDVAIARDVSNKTMAANHSRWKQEGVQFVSADEAAPPVSERGLVQVAGLKQAQEEGIQVADAEGRIPQSAIQQFLGRNGAKLQEVAASEPDTPIAEIIPAEELESLRDQIPEGVDLNSVTVADARELLAQANPEGFTPDMGGGTGGDVVQAQEQSSTPSYTPERPLGPIKPGGEFSVRSKYGNVRFRSEEWNNMKPGTIKQLKADFRARQTIAKQQNQALADEMMKAQINSWEQENKPVDPKFINQKVIDAAYPPGTPKRVAFDKKLAGLETVSKVFSNSGDKSIQELGYEVESLAPKQSKSGTAEEYNVGVETYERAKAKLAATVKLRDEDPALSVESSALIQSVRSKFENGIPKRENEKRMLIDARMLAQRQIGIPESKRSPITDGEAAYFSAQLDDVPPEEISSRIESVAEAIKQNYGKDYTGVVLKSVISNYVKRNQDKEEMINAAQTLASKREIGPLELERAKEVVDMRVRNVLNWRANQADHYAKISKSSAFRAKVQEAARLNGLSGANSLTEGLIGKGGGSNLTQGLMGKTKPPQEAIDSLRTGKITQQQFERLYGLTPAQSAQYLLRGKP